MNNQLRVFVRASLAAAALSLAPLPAVADDPTPTPTPRPAGGTSLSEVAKDTELKGTEKGRSIVITDENLAEYAEKGSVTTPETKTGSTARRPIRDPIKNPNTTVLGPDDPYHSDERRRYWVGMYERQLNLIASLRRQLQVIDEEIPGLWRDFYAWDDPAYRDGVIKPKLDEMLNKRDRIEEQLREAEPRLDEIKSQARQDGAEPGWFRGLSVPTPMPPTATPDIVID
jgi:hypothetical protein